MRELFTEHECVLEEGDPHRDAHYLRMLMDALRIMHASSDTTPVEYICPLTHQLMYDPVVLNETGHSYERKAIEQWYNK